MRDTIMWDVPIYRLHHSFDRLFHALPVCGACIKGVRDVSQREVIVTVAIPWGSEDGFVEIVKPCGGIQYRSPSRLEKLEITPIYQSPEEELEARRV